MLYCERILLGLKKKFYRRHAHAALWTLVVLPTVLCAWKVLLFRVAIE